MPVCVSTEVMRASDRWTIEHLVPSKELMVRAGRAIFGQVEWKAPVGIICGKGNNAGDGFVVASLLKDHGIDCEIVLLYEDAFSEDGRYFYDKCMVKGVRSVTEGNYGASNTILDCIFGTGFKGEVKEPAKTAIENINASGAYVVSADINSGMNGDDGSGALVVQSDLTVTIGLMKTGFFTEAGKTHYKELKLAEIGII